MTAKIRTSKAYRNLQQKFELNTTQEGLNWYAEAHALACSLGQAYGVPLDCTAQVISALSPASKWERNQRDAANIIQAFTQRGWAGAMGVSCSTYRQNKLKAIQILLGNEVINPSALKTFNFAKNIENPNDARFITIDRHAYHVLQGDGQRGSIALNPKEYTKAAAVYTVFAKDVGLLPNQVQAIAWMQYTKELGIR